ncbi:mechanosensitive ion channel family protein [Reichenbachiella agarivorans]|uniref:Mechanosensitive ion channel family protein n=1 Tax=Reichenbachiella agarivorans TaxID=2979464 RepID=A0ABY6CNR7_9BACT|nr:mechanosensitive ion channel family protein [Reichenbachiella agarivorans]UXP32014.1 mechanosensitive ion channel family protein [Reichenbachiella agarivorans]
MPSDWFGESQKAYHLFQILGTIFIIILYFSIKYIFQKTILRRAIQQNFDPARSVYVRKLIGFIIFMVCLVLAGMVWEVSLKGLSVYIASVLTIVGVGLFATWSMVSNITASLILFFFFPLKIGSKIKIVDGSNSIEGEVLNLSLFSIKILLPDGQHAYYPNNLAVQRYIIHLEEN